MVWDESVKTDHKSHTIMYYSITYPLHYTLSILNKRNGRKCAGKLKGEEHNILFKNIVWAMQIHASCMYLRNNSQI